MKCILQIISVLMALVRFNPLLAQQAPSIEWEKCLGGTSYDRAHDVRQTSDGGFVVAGYSQSIDGEVSGNNGTGDYWVVKLDASGNIMWQKSLGGSSYEEAFSVDQTTDGGFVIAGYSTSNDSDVTGNHGGTMWGDYWVVRLDMDGNMVWEKCLGGSDDDVANSVQQTSDGGFIVAGYSYSNDGDVTGHHGSSDDWVVKLDASGNIMWEKSLGGTSAEEALSVEQTSDGGYILAGFAFSNDDDVSGKHSCDSNQLYCEDYWLVKLDENGNLIWQKCLGGGWGERAYSVQQTTDGGYIIAGQSLSNDGDVSGSNGIPDYWVVKTDTIGNLSWQVCLGGSSFELARSIEQTTDNGFIVAGWSLSNNNGNVSGHHGGADYWVAKLETDGNLAWEKSLGGSSLDEAYAIHQTTDGGYIVGGVSSSLDDDVTDLHGLNPDCWIVKLSNDTATGISSLETSVISLYPNPVQTQLTINWANPTNPAFGGTICVYDMEGRMIALPTTFTNTQAQLNTEKLPDGFYTLQIRNNKTGEVEVGNFVKVK
jgi:hypothetical protein